MNKTETVIVTTVAAGMFVYGAAGLIQTSRKHRAIRREIEIDKINTIAAIRAAREIVSNKIQNGDYDGKPLSAMINDFQFYTITVNQEM